MLSEIRPRAAALAAALLLAPLQLPSATAAAADPPPGSPAGRDAAGLPDVAAGAAEQIVVTGRRPSDEPVHAIDAATAMPLAVGSAELLERVPGGDAVRNGPLAGQVQYRGMSGYRVGVTVDGMSLASGGPNWMDPPLHYAPRPLLAGIEVARGIASVRSGAETIGGAVRARLLESRFAEGESLEAHARGRAVGRSADASIAGGGIAWVASRRHRLHLLGARERGSDLHSGDGDIHPSRHERSTLGGGYGFRHGEHELGLDYRHGETRDSGNPPLPMDTRLLDSEIGGVRYRGRVGPVGVAARVYGNDVAHEMDNFSLRAPPADPTAFRRVEASSEGLGYALELSHPLLGGELAGGADGHRAGYEMRIFDPNDPAFFVDNLNDVERDRHGAWLEWRGEPASRVHAELGLRYTHVRADAGRVDARPAQVLPPAMRLRDAFNAADRSRHEDLVDWVVKLAFEARDGLRLELGAARKSRAPHHLERYLWLPLEVSAGLGDGNHYVGTIGLDPEVAHEVEGGFAWRRGPLYLAPRAFYRRVDDSIQGVPASDPDVVMVSGANGDPTPLRFANVEAEFYGLDAEWGLLLPWGLQLDGLLSWVRGRRRDVDDDLYRIAPLRGRASLRYQGERFRAGVEGVFAARQRHVSRANGESPSGGYGILNLFASFEPLPGVRLAAALENALDATWRDPLAGTSRAANSGVAPGRRIPGPGRNLTARVELAF